MTMTVQEFARLGGKARWKGKTKKERSEAMKKVRNSYRCLSPDALTDTMDAWNANTFST